MKTNRYTGMVFLLMAAFSTIHVSGQTRNRDQAVNARPTVSNTRPTRQAVTPPPASTRNIGTISRNDAQFRKEKTKVVTTRHRPIHSERVVYNNRTYDYYDGRFYVENNGRYMAAAPLRGLRVRSLPAIYSNVWFGNNLYYFYEGVFYYPRNGYYEIVHPEIGTIIPALPADYEKVFINREMFYEYNGILYTKVNNWSGKGYQVVGFLD